MNSQTPSAPKHVMYDRQPGGTPNSTNKLSIFSLFDALVHPSAIISSVGARSNLMPPLSYIHVEMQIQIL
jgi:hypothetical protein